MDNIIEIKNLSKSFGEVKAVQDLSFKVKQGELFAFLGVNGAGKSTTISIICGGLKPDCGEVNVCGHDALKGSSDIKRKLGVVFQSSALDMALSVRDNLECRAALYGITGALFRKKLDELDGLLGLRELYHRPVGKLSGGQRRKADIARALIHDPEILILDEPTTGLDPQTRKTLWDVVTTLRQQRGLTVFLTTHYMEEAADADYVIILESGKIAAQGTPLDLKNAYTGDFISLYGMDEEKIAGLELPYEKIQGGYRLAVKNTSAATDLIRKRPELFLDYEITKGKMDDVFLAVTGKKLNGDN